MKYLQKSLKKLLCAMMSSLLIVSFSIPVFADMWVPPSGIYDKGVLNQLDTAEGRKAMNHFLSNFSEVNLENYKNDGFEINMYQLNFLYKHFELNASSFKDIVLKDDGKSGKIMKIPLVTFEKEAQILLGLTIHYFNKTEVGKGYENGYFNVTANQANSPKRIFSIADKITYIGNDFKRPYQVEFAIYKAESIKDSFYSYSSKEAANNPSLKRIGNGTAEFIYVGGTGASAFELSGYSLNKIDRSELLYTEENKPVTTSGESSEPAETATVTETEAITKETTANGKDVLNDTVGQVSSRNLIYISAVVIIVALASTVVIIFVFRKKK